MSGIQVIDCHKEEWLSSLLTCFKSELIGINRVHHFHDLYVLIIKFGFPTIISLEILFHGGKLKF